MLVSFSDTGTEDIFNGVNSRKARNCCPSNLWRVARRKLDQMNAAVVLSDLASPPGNQLEPKAGDREGQHCIWINRKYRICFVWTDAGPEDVEITEYH